LFAHNREEGVGIREMLLPLLLTVAAVSVLLLVGWVLFRNAKAVALVVSAWALLFFSYGRVVAGLAGVEIGGIDIDRDAYLLSIWAGLGVLSVVLAYVARRHLSGVTTALNVVGAVLVAINLASVAVSQPSSSGGARAQRDGVESNHPSGTRPKHLPDIYYIVPEDYGVQLVHREWFGTDTSWFNRYLRSKGFYVASRSMANYQNTHQSLAASLNMEYVDSLIGKHPTIQDSYPKLKNFEVARYLKSLGYRYIHIGSWYKPTSIDPSADININYQNLSEFSSTLYQTTVLPSILRTFGVAEEKLNTRKAKYERTVAELDLLPRVRRIPGPKFVFAHLIFPHYQGPKPAAHAFDQNGRFVTQQQEERRSYRRLYGDQITFAAKKFRQIIDSLLSSPSYRPVIVLQTDEGPYLTEKLEQLAKLFDYRTATEEELRNHFLILNAYYLPGVPRNRLYPSITPVNTFRLIFDLYFQADLPLLPDRYFAYLADSRDLVNITERMRSLLRTVP
jgi:hypothetical protein